MEQQRLELVLSDQTEIRIGFFPSNRDYNLFGQIKQRSKLVWSNQIDLNRSGQDPAKRLILVRSYTDRHWSSQIQDRRSFVGTPILTFRSFETGSFET